MTLEPSGHPFLLLPHLLLINQPLQPLVQWKVLLFSSHLVCNQQNSWAHFNRKLPCVVPWILACHLLPLTAMLLLYPHGMDWTVSPNMHRLKPYPTWLYLKVRPWPSVTNVLIRRGRDTRDAAVNTQRKSHVNSQQEGGHLQTKKRGLRRNQSCQYPDFRLPASRTVRSRFLLFKPPSLWYFAMAALAN